MNERPVLIIGGGMSGLAAGIRLARFGRPVIILERHTRPGGLNSYYYRQGHLLETGLHAMTNYAGPEDRAAPLNRLFRQLKLSRKSFPACQQIGSEILFPSHCLRFTNDISFLEEQISSYFLSSATGFTRLVDFVRTYDPFTLRPWLSARTALETFIPDPVLREMLLCPLMIYGNSQEDDMDLAQFVIMFQAVFLEGFFRPQGTIRDFLALLLNHYQGLGGEIRFKSEVQSFILSGDRVAGVRLASGEEIMADAVVSTMGAASTLALAPDCLEGGKEDFVGRMSFVESIYLLPRADLAMVRHDSTCIFFSERDHFLYHRPEEAMDLGVGVINFPMNFDQLPQSGLVQIRVTHPANYQLFLEANIGARQGRSNRYAELKTEWQQRSLAKIGKMIGNFSQNIVYQDTFTPLTIEAYSGKADGAVYGSPRKVKDGQTRYSNLFLAGTDQGFLGIVGAMLSGVTIVNQHLLTKASG